MEKKGDRATEHRCGYKNWRWHLAGCRILLLPRLDFDSSAPRQLYRIQVMTHKFARRSQGGPVGHHAMYQSHNLPSSGSIIP